MRLLTLGCSQPTKTPMLNLVVHLTMQAKMIINKIKPKNHVFSAGTVLFVLLLTDLFVVKIDWPSRDLSGASPPSRRDDLSDHIS